MYELYGTINETDITPAYLKEHTGCKIEIHGYIYKIRLMSGFAFVVIRTRRRMVQCIYIADKADFGKEELIEGACVNIGGMVVADERSRTGYEIQMQTLEQLSKPEEEFPITIQNKVLDVGLDQLLNYRPLTLRNEKERAIFKIQEGLGRGFRDFLFQNGFTEIRTPKIVYAGAEGGANIFKLDYFGREAFLAQSPQFYKQAMVAVYERVFEVGPVYRAEKHHTSRHLNEYTSMDIEMGFIHSMEDIMKTEIALLQYMMRFLEEEYGDELRLLQVVLPKVESIPVVTFAEAKQLIEKKYNRKPVDLFDFEPEEEQLLCNYFKKKYGSRFVFVTHYPSEKRPFYAMDDPSDSDVTLSYDLLFDGIEITTGGQRIHLYTQQVEKMVKRKMKIEEFESYLMAHLYGMPPHGGFGMGLERLTMKLLGQQNIRFATLFPRDQMRLTP